jgi:hypothetical protein
MLKPIPPPPIPPPPVSYNFHQRRPLEVYELPPIELPPVMHAVRPYTQRTQSIIGHPHETRSSTIYKRRMKLSNDANYTKRAPIRSHSYIGSHKSSHSFVSIPEVRKPYYKSESYMIRREPSVVIEPTPPPRRRKVRKVTVYVPRTRSGSISSSESEATAEFVTRAVVHRSRSYQFNEDNFSNYDSSKEDEKIEEKKDARKNQSVSVPKEEDEKSVSSEKEKAFFKPVRNSESNHNLN